MRMVGHFLNRAKVRQASLATGSELAGGSSSLRGSHPALRIIALTTWFLLPSTAWGGELFDPHRTTIPIRGYPFSIIVGDFDGDVLPDQAVLHFDDVVSRLTVFLGSDPGRTRLLSQGVGGYGWDIVASGDFNLDEKTDLAISGYSVGGLIILNGDGQGGFSYSSGFPTGYWTSSLIVADFNADGLLDLAQVNDDCYGEGTEGCVGIYMADAPGVFGWRRDVLVGFDPGIGTTGDFNRDGNADLVIPCLNSGAVYVLWGDGEGGFGVGTESTLPWGVPYYVSVTDFDRDGEQDLAVSVWGLVGGGVVQILKGNGRGRFVSQATLPVTRTDHRPYIQAVGDFNMDENPDLAVGSWVGSGPSLVDVYLGDGGAGFSRVATLRLPGRPFDLDVSDLDLDGATDLVVATFDSHSLSVYYGNRLRGLSQETSFSLSVFAASHFAATSADFNDNGTMDVAVVGNSLPGPLPDQASGFVDLLLGDGHGGFSRRDPLPIGPNPRAVLAADFNADNRPDLAVANGDCCTGPGTVSLLLGLGAGEFSLRTTVQVGFGPKVLVHGDFNIDGRGDLGVLTTGSPLTLLPGNGTGGFGDPQEIEIGLQPTSLATADFNLDGRPDFVVGHAASYASGAFVEILLSDASSGFTTRSIQSGLGPPFVVAGDFDGDNLPDVAFTGNRGGSDGGLTIIRICHGDGGGGCSRITDQRLPDVRDLDWNGTLLAGDVNGDANLDLIIFAGSYEGGPYALLGDGHGEFPSTTLLGVLSIGGFYPLVQGDFDGDHNVDLGAIVARLDVDVSENLVWDSALTVLLNRVRERTDVNRSNRRDGFDISAIGRSFGTRSGDAAYHRSADVDLNGVIDGDDLCLVADQFGEIVSAASPFRGRVETNSSPAAATDTVTFQPAPAAGDLFPVEVQVNDGGHGAAAARFAVDFDPESLDYVDFKPGSYLAAENKAQLFNVALMGSGHLDVMVSRFPNENTTGARNGSLLTLLFRGRSEGQSTLGFSPVAESQPALLNSNGGRVSAIQFLGPALVSLEKPVDAPGSARLAVSPERIDFGIVRVGQSALRHLRLTNFGSTGLSVDSLQTSLRDFTLITSGGFNVPPGVTVEIGVRFAPTQAKVLEDDLLIFSNDPLRSPARVLLRGISGGVSISSTAVDFGPVLRGTTKTRKLTVGNRGEASLSLAALELDNGQFVATPLFTNLAPGVAGQVEVRFQPFDCRAAHGRLTLRFEGAEAATLDVDLEGEGSPDWDGDTLCDDQDPCPNDRRNDSDEDGICGDTDNCPDLANPDQRNLDQDARGDACDEDDDNDGAPDQVDNCPVTWNANQADLEGDGVGNLCDNCPEAPNPGQEDGNADGAGDACQPVVKFTTLQEDGGPELEVTVQLTDPDGDALHGTVRIHDLPIALYDSLAIPDPCAVPLPPDSHPGIGITFGNYLGARLLFDADAALNVLGVALCQDGEKDYELGFGMCGSVPSFDQFIDVTLVSLPQPICVRRVDNGDMFDLSVLSADTEHAILQQVRSATTYEDSALPEGIDLTALTPGETYELEITASDGDTPEVTDRKRFLYQGETTLLFITP